jgi:hypothetical protein
MTIKIWLKKTFFLTTKMFIKNCLTFLESMLSYLLMEGCRVMKDRTASNVVVNVVV